MPEETADVIQEYPPFVSTAEARERWDLCRGIAEELFGDLGAEAVWGATRAIFSSDIPTTDAIRSGD